MQTADHVGERKRDALAGASDLFAEAKAIGKELGRVSALKEVIDEACRLASASAGGSEYTRAMIEISKFALARMDAK